MSHVATVLRLARLAGDYGFTQCDLEVRLEVDSEDLEHDSLVGVIDAALSEQDANWIEERIMA